jgi:hypothetical protein
VVLIVAMLSLLIAFFALFVGLVRFAEHVIRPRSEAALHPAGDWSKGTASQDATSLPHASQPTSAAWRGWEAVTRRPNLLH